MDSALDITLMIYVKSKLLNIKLFDHNHFLFNNSKVKKSLLCDVEGFSCLCLFFIFPRICSSRPFPNNFPLTISKIVPGNSQLSARYRGKLRQLSLQPKENNLKISKLRYCQSYLIFSNHHCTIYTYKLMKKQYPIN